MNLSSIFGVFAALAVVVVAIVTSSKSAQVFLDPHGILCVIGGTTAAGLMCFPLRFYTRIGGVLVNKFLGSYATRYETVITELTDLARGARENPDYLKQKVKSIRTPFLRDAVELIVQGGISEDDLETILLKRASTHSKRYDYDVNVIRTIAKFPPAFGLMGTTLGMISLLQQLGGKDSQKMLGPAMAVGLVATFYGIVLANLVLIPISENLAMINREDETIRSIVIDGIRLVRDHEHPKLVEEHLKSYLLPNERAKLKKAAAAPA
ncbi:MAG: MotA/TolQ/ExbB proton channel family protein [Oligoflexia bacterium]|nr:MotA/TolQ/ExbB proton channel family protein [Oligoflexia bacterium]